VLLVVPCSGRGSGGESVASALTLPTKKTRKVRVGWPSARRPRCWHCARWRAGTRRDRGQSVRRGTQQPAQARFRKAKARSGAARCGARARSAHLMRRRRRRRSTRLRALTIAQKNLRARGHGSRGVGGEPCGREEAQQPGLWAALRAPSERALKGCRPLEAEHSRSSRSDVGPRRRIRNAPPVKFALPKREMKRTSPYPSQRARHLRCHAARPLASVSAY
jgi:hypothetical protein